MSEVDRTRWNARYRERQLDLTPAASLVALTDRLKPVGPATRALDLACGTGRNALYLAELGYEVEAWDLSEVALNQLRAEIERRAAAGRRLSIVVRQVDLDRAALLRQPELLPVSRFDLIVDYYYLERALFRAIARALRPGGLLVFETVLDVEAGRARIANPDHRLARGELGAAFPGLETLEYVEDESAGRALLFARRPGAEPARREPSA